MKYRKKQIIVDAIQFFITKEENSNLCDCFDFCGGTGIGKDLNGNVYLSLSTLEGLVKVFDGDWIIKEVEGELYPVKNDIFEKTYEKIEEAKDE